MSTTETQPSGGASSSSDIQVSPDGNSLKRHSSVDDVYPEGQRKKHASGGSGKKSKRGRQKITRQVRLISSSTNDNFNVIANVNNNALC